MTRPGTSPCGADPNDRIEILVNPRARQIRRSKDLDLARWLGPHDRVHRPLGLDALDRTAASIATDPPAVLGLVGGDGTCGRSLSALTHAFGDDPLPPIALLGGGTMNTIARSIGATEGPRRAVRRLVAWREGRGGWHPVTRHLLEVDGHRRGLLFGNGLFARYIDAYEATGTPGPARAAWVLARATWSALTGGPHARELTAPIGARITLDDTPLPDAPWRVVAAGTVDQVGLGFQPFRAAITHPGQLAMIAIACPPAELATRLHRTWRGRPLDHPDVVERTGTRLIIEADDPQLYMLDGDLGESRPRTTVTVGPRVTLLSPRAPHKRAVPRADSTLEAAGPGRVDDRPQR